MVHNGVKAGADMHMAHRLQRSKLPSTKTIVKGATYYARSIKNRYLGLSA